MKREEYLMKEHQEKEREAEARRRDLQEQEDAAIAEIGSVNFRRVLKRVGNGLTANFGIKMFDTEDSAQKKAKILKQNRIEALEAELAVREK